MPTDPSAETNATRAHTAPPSSPAAAERFPPGTLIGGRYRVVAVLGKGGMGEVCRADDLALGQPVALKFLPEHLAGDPDRLALIRKEVAAARRVSHPNVCRVYDIAEHDGHSFLTMEFIDGEDLSSVLTRLGRVPEEKGVEIAKQLCSALAAVHDLGLLHRDLKPANVMLDGRGRVRLADFGLAVPAADVTAEEVRSGTPLYMAPEQAAGREVTVRSDLFSLGLVLYELFTGRRAYPDARRDSSPTKPSTHVSNLNPTVERTILRCLELDPALRPKSANEVLLGLPGGDPLAAALAAGETPSPQLVADAGAVGLISPRVGAALLAAVGLVLVAFAAMYPEVMAFGKVGGLPKSTEWLSGKAREVRELAGHPERAASAVGYDFDGRQFDWIADTQRSPDRWDRLARPPGAPLAFWHRESPRPLLPGLFYPYPGSIETTRVTWADPPPMVPGMTGARLAPDGRLIEFHAVPLERAEPAERTPEWEAWFGKADLKLSQFRPVADRAWVPPVFVEKAFTWVPADPTAEGLPVRVEAGTHRDRVVWFRATPEWSVASEGESGQAIGDQGSAVGLPVVYVPLILFVFALAPVTLRSGSADRRGAFLLGTGVFAVMMLVWMLETRHVASLDEVRLFAFGTAGALYWAALVGFAYLVLEPFVRRWWPETVVSWNRLLVGRWRDPLVGRDVLVGVLAGAAWVVIGQLANQVPKWAGEPAPMPWWDWWVPNTQVSGLWAGNFLMNLAYSFRFAFFYCLLFLLLLRAVFRRPWLAGVAFVAITTLTQANDLGFRSPSLGWPLIAVGQFLLLATVVRFGALAATVMSFVMNTLWFPMTSDPARDYFTGGLLALGSVVALAVYGFHTATGRRRLFGADFHRLDR